MTDRDLVPLISANVTESAWQIRERASTNSMVMRRASRWKTASEVWSFDVLELEGPAA